jgi:hypothetical protein
MSDRQKYHITEIAIVIMNPIGGQIDTWTDSDNYFFDTINAKKAIH